MSFLSFFNYTYHRTDQRNLFKWLWKSWISEIEINSKIIKPLQGKAVNIRFIL